MEAFCGSPLWGEESNTSLSPNATESRWLPDAPDCFQNTVLVWAPCGFIIVIAPIYVIWLRSLHRSAIRQNWFNVTKTILCVALALLCLVDLFEQVQLHVVGEARAPAHLLAPAFRFMAMLVALIVIQLERKKGMRLSMFLFLHWFIQCIAFSIILRSWVIQFREDRSKLKGVMTFSLLIFLTLFQLILANFVDRPPVNKDNKKVSKPSLEDSATVFSRITFWWMTRLIIAGYKNALTQEDLWELNPSDRSERVVPIFMRNWNKELIKREQSIAKSTQHSIDEELPLKDKNGESTTPAVRTKQKPTKIYLPSLWYTMARSFGPMFLMGSFLKLIHDILVFVSPALLGLLISFTRDKTQPLWRGYLYASLMFVNALVQSILLQQYFHRCFLAGMRTRTGLIAAIYRKALKLSSAARRNTTVGEIVNLMSVDAQRFMELTTYLNMLWSAPFQMCVCLYFLWATLGPSILAGVAIMIILIPINGVIAKKTRALQVEQMKHKDVRIKLMNEVLNGIKVLKLYAWELSFQEKVLGIRNLELKVLRKTAFLNAATSFTWTCAPFLVAMITFAVYVMSSDKNVLDAEKAFVSLSLFNILRFPLSILPMLIATMVQTTVSIKRLQKFLISEELEPNNVEVLPESDSDTAITIENGTFRWDEEEERVTLNDLNVTIPSGSLVAVVGVVGCGKSSMLSAILGEMEKMTGKVTVQGSVAYVAQQAWIQNQSLQDNVLFAAPMDQCRYQKVLEACSLIQDLDMLPAGDMTEIGEKGINLSGGQKQRVSLARAVYQDADVYLLDDPLSAVDAHVGKHIFKNVIGPNGMLKDKTRVLVTHGLTYLPKVDRIVVVVDGRISEVGTYQELLDKQGAFAEVLRTYLTQDEEENEDPDEEDMEVREKIRSSCSLSEIPRSPIVRHRKRLYTNDSLSSRHGSTRSLHRSVTALSPEKEKCLANGKLKTEQEKDELIKAEKAETGSVKLSVFRAYMSSMGVVTTIMIIVLYLINYAANVGANVWLSDWSNDVPVNGTMDPEQRDMRLGVYTALGMTQGVAVICGAFCLAFGSLRASTNLHQAILKNCLRSPMSFYDTTPLGRIVNRFAKDIDVIDTIIPRNLDAWGKCTINVMATVIMISYATPLFMAVIFPLGIFYFFVQRFYVSTSRQLKRLESVSRSPIYSNFGETIQGVSTIRAYRQQDRFRLQSEHCVDTNQQAYFPSIVSNRWLAVRLEMVGNIIVLFAAIFAVIGRDHLSAGIVGLSVSYALNITQTLNWMVRMTSELETNIVAVERVKEYAETPTEAEWFIEEKKPEPDWPQKGAVEIRNYSTRYREGLDLVLQGISASIQPGEKVGIVGRTGAGKSSLTLGLFRIIEPAGGSILVDGVNIAEIGLHDLRSKLTIIPQDPVLFSGSLRMNLDPFDEKTDDDLWRSLELAHLKTFVSGLPNKLEHECTEGGENLSVGQRQLVCLARALLRHTRVLILDEATAAVDLETDDLIQNTIRTQFKGCTVVTIAHRLNTIMDYDRILVLDKGQISEFESPQSLLDSKSGIFYSMAKDAGLVD